MNKIYHLFIIAILAISCQSEDTSISLNKVGVITNKTTVNQINDLFKNDSIVSRLSEGDLGNINDYIQDSDTYLIYKKGGELQLSIAPVNSLDKASKIRSITVFSNEYLTKSDVGISSTFNDLNINHTIEKLEATFKFVTVFVKDINATFTIDKSKLNIKAFTLGEIKKEQIPEASEFTSFTVWFNE